MLRVGLCGFLSACGSGLTCGAGTYEADGVCLSDTPGAADVPFDHDLVVCQDGGDFTTIQAAIDAAAEGAVIALCPGVWPERLTVDHGLTLRSIAGAADTFLDAERLGTAISVEGAALVVQGLTIERGENGITGGAAIDASLSDLTLTEVDVRANAAGVASVYVRGGTVTMTDVAIRENDGVALWTEDGATAEVHRASFVNNHVGGFNLVMLNGDTVMSNVVLADNTFSTTIGGGVLFTSSTFYGSNLLLEVPTFVLAFRGDGATVHSSIVTGPGNGSYGKNNAFTYTDFNVAGCPINDDGACLDIATGEGNLTGDPRLRDAAAGDYHLDELSPCVDAGDPRDAWKDVDGSRNDCGPYGGPEG